MLSSFEFAPGRPLRPIECGVTRQADPSARVSVDYLSAEGLGTRLYFCLMDHRIYRLEL